MMWNQTRSDVQSSQNPETGLSLRVFDCAPFRSASEIIH